MASSKRVKVKLFIDTEKDRVVFAESDKDFVDILFSFLTLPLSTVIRVVGKNSSSFGSIVQVYESVENFGSQHLQSDALKAMLLRPRNAAGAKCEDLVINLDDTDFRTSYVCRSCSGLQSCHGFGSQSCHGFFYSLFPGAHCKCGKLMDLAVRSEKVNTEATREGVFVEGGPSLFYISNDLNVAPASVSFFKYLFKSMEIEDAGKLEERILLLGAEEITSLFRKSLFSMSALTALHSCKPNYEDATSYENAEAILRPKQESDVDFNAKKIKLKLHVTKSSNKVLFAEVEEDMVDLLISWLTFPLGLLIKHTKNLTNGCIVNLYKSVESCSYLKSEECKSLLLSPKLGAFHGCSSHLLEGEEMASETRNLSLYSSHISFAMGTPISSRVSRNFEELNPRKLGDGYARVSGKFIVTDDLRVLELSLHSFVHILKEFKISVSGLVEKEATIGEAQALDLLRAAFVSHTVLSDVFCAEIK